MQKRPTYPPPLPAWTSAPASRKPLQPPAMTLPSHLPIPAVPASAGRTRCPALLVRPPSERSPYRCVVGYGLDDWSTSAASTATRTRTVRRDMCRWDILGVFGGGIRRQTRKENSVESKTKKHGESVKRVIYQCRTRPAGGRGPHATGTCSE